MEKAKVKWPVKERKKERKKDVKKTQISMKQQHRPHGKMKIHKFLYYGYIYTFRVSKHISGQSMNINVFSWLLSFFKLRKREW